MGGVNPRPNRCTTSNGMSSHGLNGLGSVVATIGLFIVVGVSIGAAVERNCTPGAATGAGGALWQTTTTAVSRAPNAASSRSLPTMTHPRVISSPAGSLQVAPAPPQ